MSQAEYLKKKYVQNGNFALEAVGPGQHVTILHFTEKAEKNVQAWLDHYNSASHLMIGRSIKMWRIFYVYKIFAKIERKMTYFARSACFARFLCFAIKPIGFVAAVRRPPRRRFRKEQFAANHKTMLHSWPQQLSAQTGCTVACVWRSTSLASDLRAAWKTSGAGNAHDTKNYFW